MCSLNDCYENDVGLVKSDAKIISKERNCKKCQGTDIFVFLRGTDAYCKECFSTNTNHKFRAAIGKAKIIRRGDSVLLNHSGEANSTALLHLIRSGMHESTHKRLIFKTIVIYIDEGTINNKDNKERRATVEKIAEQVKSFGFEGYAVHLADSLDNSLHIHSLAAPIVSPEKDKYLEETLRGLPDATAREDFLRILQRKILLSAASKLACNKAFVADSSNDLAVEILSDMSLGRGTQVSSDINFSDCRDENVMLLRPMRDFSKEEIIYYLTLHDIDPIVRNDTINRDTRSSIRNLTRSFVEGLESEYCGTISTVFRTGEKLRNANTNAEMDYGNCILCKSSLDTAPLSDTTSAIDATAYSKMISTKPSNGAMRHCENNSDWKNVKTCRDEGKACNCVNGKPAVSLENFYKCLCYGCKLIFNGVESKTAIPPFLIKLVEERLSLTRMQEEIADFLI